MKDRKSLRDVVLKVFKSIFAYLVIDIDSKDYDKKTKTFSFEMSSKDLSVAPKLLLIRNPKTNDKIMFRMTKKDYDATGEDIYGFWYESDDKNYKLLLIND